MRASDSTAPEVREPARPRRTPVPRIPKTFFYQKVVPAALILIAVITLLTLVVAMLAATGVIRF